MAIACHSKSMKHRVRSGMHGKLLRGCNRKKKNTKEILCEIYGQCTNLGTPRQSAHISNEQCSLQKAVQMSGGLETSRTDEGATILLTSQVQLAA